MGAVGATLKAAATTFVWSSSLARVGRVVAVACLAVAIFGVVWPSSARSIPPRSWRKIFESSDPSRVRVAVEGGGR